MKRAAPITRTRKRELILSRAKPSKGKGRTLRLIGATENVARDGGILKADGWRLDEYRANPVFLYAHQHDGLPLGRTTKVERSGDDLVFDVEFPKRGVHPFADTVFDLYRTGFMKATSVGFRVRKQRDPTTDERERGAEWVSTSHDLLELSAVPVGADPGALAVAARTLPRSAAKHLRSMGLDAFVDLAREVEAMKHTVEERDGKIVVVLREPSDFGDDAKFVEHEFAEGIVAIVGILDGDRAVQGLRFEEESFDVKSAQAWIDEEGRSDVLIAWREDVPDDEDEDEETPPPSDEDEDEDEDDEDRADEDEEDDEDAPPPPADDDEDEDEDEERVYTRSDLVTILREAAQGLTARADEIESPSDDPDEDEEEDPDEDAPPKRSVSSRLREDRYGIEALARKYAGE